MKGGRRLDAPDGMRRAEAAGESAAHTELTIGELAARAGVTAEAIRYYEREGVVPAAARGGAGRYRRYTEADTTRLRFIRRARDLGFSLHEVRGLLALAEGNPGRSCTDVNRIARAHLAQVDAKLAQLTKLRAELDRVIASCGGVVPVAKCHILGTLSGTE
jgi:MerR family mercuric resistance operon transcriptional regulator